MLLRRSKTQARVQESVDRDGRQLLVDFDGASDELLHDFVGSAVDARHPGVRELPSDRVLPHESGAAMQLVNKETKAKRKKWIKVNESMMRFRSFLHFCVCVLFIYLFIYLCS